MDLIDNKEFVNEPFKDNSSKVTEYKIEIETKLATFDIAEGLIFKVPKLTEIEMNAAENPLIGYKWQLKEFECPSIMKTGETYTDPPVIFVGAKGHRVFKFQTLKAGDCSLKFENSINGEGAHTTQTINLSIY